MIHRLSSGHMFSWSLDLVEINRPISDQFEILHFVNIERKKKSFMSYGKDLNVWV